MGLIKDKRAFSLIFGLMLGVVIILLALALAPPLQDTISEVRNNTLLNCSTTDNPQLKAVCTSIDMNMLFVGVLVGVGFIVIMRMV